MEVSSVKRWNMERLKELHKTAAIGLLGVAILGYAADRATYCFGRMTAALNALDIDIEEEDPEDIG